MFSYNFEIVIVKLEIVFFYVLEEALGAKDLTDLD